MNLPAQKVREMLLDAKSSRKLTWPQLAEAIGRSPVCTAMLVYGYGQASDAEVDGLLKALDLPVEIKTTLMQIPHRQPAQPWPPTDPFIYRLYEAVMLYGPVYKDVAHEIFGDGIMSAIDMSVDIAKIEDPVGVPRMVITLNGKWLQYKKY
ncbi:MAG: cyanase [Pseudomonadota bacterium]